MTLKLHQILVVVGRKSLDRRNEMQHCLCFVCKISFYEVKQWMGYVLVVIKSGLFFGCVSPGNVIEPHRHICASFWMQSIEGDCEQWQSSCQSPRFFPIPRMLLSFWFPTIKHNHKIWPHHASKGIAICNHWSVFAFLFLTRNHNSGLN